MPDLERSSEIVREIIRLSAGSSIVGKSRLYKAFYFSHLAYAEQNPDYLSDWPIVRMPHGPGINDAELLIDKLVRDKEIEARPATVGPYRTTQYICLKDRVTSLPIEMIDAIKTALDFIEDKSAAELSELTHEFSHSWRESDDGDELNIYIDLLSDEEYEERKARVDGIISDLNEAWG